MIIALPVGWSEAVDPSNGRVYYKNHYTKATTWERPVAAGHGGIAALQGAQPTGYNTLFDIAAQTGEHSIAHPFVVCCCAVVAVIDWLMQLLLDDGLMIHTYIHRWSSY
jgi:hypothetical protein